MLIGLLLLKDELDFRIDPLFNDDRDGDLDTMILLDGDWLLGLGGPPILLPYTCWSTTHSRL